MYVYSHIPNHQKTHTMETITITHRKVNGRNVYNKRFDDYDKGFYGLPISKAEYMESRENKALFTGNEVANKALNIVERVTYYN